LFGFLFKVKKKNYVPIHNFLWLHGIFFISQ
jgi:hypothetical protein